MSTEPSELTGTFITIEGGEGSGKSTLSRLLQNSLNKIGHHVTLCREPGGTVLGEQLRAALFSQAGSEVSTEVVQAAPSPLTELLVFSAARAQLLKEIILPALGDGDTVICDRYTDSTFAYQHYGRGLDRPVIETAVRLTVGNLKPSLTILLDLDPEQGLARHGIVNQKDLFGEMSPIGGNNYLDFESLAFHQKIREGYLEMASLEPDRWLVLDAGEDPDVIARIALDAILQLIK